MENGKFIVEEAVYGFKGESNSFYGYFGSPELAAAWIQDNCPSCDMVEENREYQVSGYSGCTTWIIHDTEDESFKEHVDMMKAADRAYFDETYMLPTE